MDTDEYSELRAKKDVRGRGSGDMTKSRFLEAQTYYVEEEGRQIATIVYKDFSKSILSKNDSPDIGFGLSLNPYRGCEHGCVYCYARPTHEYFGLSAGLDFESKIFAKFDAPKLLEEALNKKSYHPETLVMSGVTDCYQPVETELKITRQCLHVLASYKNPTVIITKNHNVVRDIDVLKELHLWNAIHVVISLTTLDPKLARAMEPRASSPARRLLAIATLRQNGIPVSVNMAPIIPGLTDHEIPTLLKAAKEAGAQRANYTMVRLPYGVKDIFQTWLEDNFPDKKNKVLNRIKEMRQGKLNSSEFGTRMRGDGAYAEHIGTMFSYWREKLGLTKNSLLTAEHFKKHASNQLALF